MMSDVKKDIQSFLELNEKDRHIKPFGTHENVHKGKPNSTKGLHKKLEQCQTSNLRAHLKVSVSQPS